MNILIHSFLLSLLPIFELRGGIPYAVANDVDIVTAYIVCVVSNMLVIPFLFLFLETFHKVLYKVRIYQRLFDYWVNRTRKKAEKNIGRFGYWGIMLFVAIPLPITGAYTGTLAAWILKLDKKRSSFYLFLGVAIAGLIVSVVTLTGFEMFDIFLKR